MSPLLSSESESFLKENNELNRKFKDHYAYYREDNLRYFQKTIQHDSIVLIIGCDTGFLVERLKAKEIHVLDLNPCAENRGGTNIHVVKDLEKALASTPFDYVILPSPCST